MFTIIMSLQLWVKMFAQTVTEKLSETSRQGAELVISVFDVQLRVLLSCALQASMTYPYP